MNRWRVHTGKGQAPADIKPAHNNPIKVIFLVDALQTSKIKHSNEKAMKKTIHRFNIKCYKQKDVQKYISFSPLSTSTLKGLLHFPPFI